MVAGQEEEKVISDVERMMVFLEEREGALRSREGIFMKEGEDNDYGSGRFAAMKSQKEKDPSGLPEGVTTVLATVAADPNLHGPYLQMVEHTYSMKIWGIDHRIATLNACIDGLINASKGGGKDKALCEFRGAEW